MQLEIENGPFDFHDFGLDGFVTVTATITITITVTVTVAITVNCCIHIKADLEFVWKSFLTRSFQTFRHFTKNENKFFLCYHLASIMQARFIRAIDNVQQIWLLVV